MYVTPYILRFLSALTHSMCIWEPMEAMKKKTGNKKNRQAKKRLRAAAMKKAKKQTAKKAMKA